MALTLIQKLHLIVGGHWKSLGYEFLGKTAQEAADEIDRLRAEVETFKRLANGLMSDGGRAG